MNLSPEEIDTLRAYENDGESVIGVLVRLALAQHAARPLDALADRDVEILGLRGQLDEALRYTGLISRSESARATERDEARTFLVRIGAALGVSRPRTPPDQPDPPVREQYAQLGAAIVEAVTARDRDRDAAHDARIEAQNPGIDLAEVRARRAKNRTPAPVEAVTRGRGGVNDEEPLAAQLCDAYHGPHYKRERPWGQGNTSKEIGWERVADLVRARLAPAPVLTAEWLAEAMDRAFDIAADWWSRGDITDLGGGTGNDRDGDNHPARIELRDAVAEEVARLAPVTLPVAPDVVAERDEAREALYAIANQLHAREDAGDVAELAVAIQSEIATLINRVRAAEFGVDAPAAAVRVDPVAGVASPVFTGRYSLTIWLGSREAFPSEVPIEDRVSLALGLLGIAKSDPAASTLAAMVRDEGATPEPTHFTPFDDTATVWHVAHRAIGMLKDARPIYAAKLEEALARIDDAPPVTPVQGEPVAAVFVPVIFRGRPGILHWRAGRAHVVTRHGDAAESLLVRDIGNRGENVTPMSEDESARHASTIARLVEVFARDDGAHCTVVPLYTSPPAPVAHVPVQALRDALALAESMLPGRHGIFDGGAWSRLTRTAAESAAPVAAPVMTVEPKRFAVGDEVTATITGTVRDVSDSHGLCYEIRVVYETGLAVSVWVDAEHVRAPVAPAKSGGS